MSVSMFAVCLASAGRASAAFPPSRDADQSAPVAKVVPHNNTDCSATGTWFETGGYMGPGSWTKTAKRKCKAPGVWTDSFTYTWSVKKHGKGVLKGTVNYHGLPNCTDQVWPVAGAYGKTTISVTATNPDPNDPNCVQQFGYNLTIQ